MEITRRVFLRTSSAAAVGCALPGLAASAPITSERRQALVLVFLRGGNDGLNLIVPHAEEEYYRLRPAIAIPRPGQPNGALDLDGRFGLHPAAAPLLPLFQEGTAAALHAVGWEHNTRSHFVEQDAWETAQVGGNPRAEGWLNRHLSTSQGHGPIRAVALGGSLPRSLRGEAAALALRGLGELSFDGGGDRMATQRALREAYDRGDGDARRLLSREATDTLEALDELRAVISETPESEVEYPQGPLGQQLREGARMIRADFGLEVLAVDFGGWDTHQNQGGAQGAYAGLVGQLSGSLSAFAQDVGDRLDDVVVLAVSEFGRTAAENGTRGTDHGWGNCMLALGGAVRRKAGGKPRGVLGTWPGMEREQLRDQRDLAHTTDFRDVLAEVTTKQLGNPALAEVVPEHAPVPVGLI